MAILSISFKKQIPFWLASLLLFRQNKNKRSQQYFASSALQFAKIFVTLHTFYKNKSSFLGIILIIMKRTKIEQLLAIIAWVGLISGFLFTLHVSKGIWESGQDMAFPQAVLTFVGGVGASVVGWALLMQLISLSERISRIENKLKESKKITTYLIHLFI